MCCAHLVIARHTKKTEQRMTRLTPIRKTPRRYAEGLPVVTRRHVNNTGPSPVTEVEHLRSVTGDVTGTPHVSKLARRGRRNEHIRSWGRR